MKTIASLFSGGELFGVGAIQAGYKHLWGVELDDKIAAVARLNGFNVITADVRDVDFGGMKKPTHLHASPPCPSFSVANKNRGETETDLQLAEAVCRAITELNPKTFTLENVPAYVHSQSFKMVLNCLLGQGYFVDVQNLNAANFAVPQTRRRLWVRASKQLLSEYPAPTKWMGWYEAIEDLIPSLPDTEFAPWQLARMGRELLDIVRNSQSWYTSTKGVANYERVSSQVLCILQERTDPKILSEWGAGIVEGFQQAEVLRPNLYGSEFRENKTIRESKQEQYAQIFSEICSRWFVPNMWSAKRNRCTSQKLKLDGQFPREFATYLSQLSCESSQPSKILFNTWMQRGALSQRILQQTQSSFQEIWRSVIYKDKDCKPQEETNDNAGCFECGSQDKDLGNIFGQTVQESADCTKEEINGFLIGQGARSEALEKDEPIQTITSNSNQTGIKAFLIGGANTSAAQAAPDVGVSMENEPTRCLATNAGSWKAFVMRINQSECSPNNFLRGEEPIMTISAGHTEGKYQAFVLDGGNAGTRGSKITLRNGEEPLHTVTASFEKSPVRGYIGNGRVVKMTVQALGRFQTVPDRYKGLTVKINGNGVPCKLAEAVLKTFGD